MHAISTGTPYMHHQNVWNWPWSHCEVQHLHFNLPYFCAAPLWKCYQKIFLPEFPPPPKKKCLDLNV